MPLHQLTCPCGRPIPVGAGQAGGEVCCPACGRLLPVPTLRELRGLPLAEGPAVSVRGSAGGGFIRSGGGRLATTESFLFAGLATAAICLGIASWLARPISTGIDEEVIRMAIARVPAADLYRAWSSLGGSGVDRPPTPEEERVSRLTRNRNVIAVGVGLVGAMGGLTAVAAAAMIGCRRWLGHGPA